MTLLDQRMVETASVETLPPFVQRHIGPGPAANQLMLDRLGFTDLEGFLQAVVPQDILDSSPPKGQLPAGVGEEQALSELRQLAGLNRVTRSLIGLGYYGTVTPALIQRQVLENPSCASATPLRRKSPRGVWRLC